MKTFVLAMMIGLALAGASVAQDDSASINFVVIKWDNGKPVRNAGVVMHPVKKNGKQERGGIELKTDAEGKASFDGVPYGKLRVQVLAPGFQTFGEDYDINQPTIEIRVKMKRPAEQYSIYKDHQNDTKDDKGEAPPADEKAKPN